MSSPLSAVADKLRRLANWFLAHRGPRWALYAGCFGFFFVLFAYLTFPYDRARDVLIKKVESGELGTRHMQLDIESLRPALLTGVSLTGVDVALAPSAGQTEPRRIHIDELEVHVSLIRLLFGTTAIDFDAELAGGEISGELDTAELEQRLEMTFDSVDLSKLSIVKDTLGLPIGGIINGSIDIDLPEQLAEGQGLIDLKVENTKIGDGKSKLPIPGMSQGLTISPLTLGTLVVEIPIEAGRGQVRKFEAKGKDADLSASGTVSLARPLGNSLLNLMLRVKFSDGYKKRDDASRRLFAAMDFAPELRSASTSDGSLQFKVNGTFRGSLSAKPAGTKKAGGGLPF